MFTAYKGEHHIPANGNNQLVFKVQRVAAAQRKDDFQTDTVHYHTRKHRGTVYGYCDIPTFGTKMKYALSSASHHVNANSLAAARPSAVTRSAWTLTQSVGDAGGHAH